MRRKSEHTLVRFATPAEALARTRSRKKRFLMVSGAALAVLGVMMGVSFLDQSGTASISVSGNTPAGFVYPVSSGGAAPSASTLTGLRYGTTVGTSLFGTSTNLHMPSWSPAAGSPGSVFTAGDIALIDATNLSSSQQMIVNMFVTNLPGLGGAYSSFAFPVNLYSCTTSCAPQSSQTGGTAGNWTQVSGVITNDTNATSTTFLTNTEGFLSFSLQGGKYYDITFNAGGSFYTVSTTNGSLNPSFYFTAKAAG